MVGLAPTNAVAQDMKADGFGRAARSIASCSRSTTAAPAWDGRTVVMVDEAAMLDTKLMAMVTAHAARRRREADPGRRRPAAFEHRPRRHVRRAERPLRRGRADLGCSRQHKNDDRRAAEMMAEGNFSDALACYDQKGAIHWTRTQGEARAALVKQWAKDSAADPEKSRFVFAYTNDDVATLNAGLARACAKQRGELGADSTCSTRRTGGTSFAAGDRIQFTGTDKKAGHLQRQRRHGARAIEGTRVTASARRPAGPHHRPSTRPRFERFRHGYAGTIYKAQGRTLDQTYLYHSEHWRSAASYVALTRHRDTGRAIRRQQHGRT